MRIGAVELLEDPLPVGNTDSRPRVGDRDPDDAVRALGGDPHWTAPVLGSVVEQVDEYLLDSI